MSVRVLVDIAPYAQALNAAQSTKRRSLQMAAASPQPPKEAPMKKVTLEHKDLKDQPVTVPASTAEVLKKSGWKEAPKSRQADA